MRVPKFLAVGLIAAGLVIGGSTVAHAATASQYVTVLWSYPGYPDITQPQPFVNSYAGADLHVFDATLAQGDSCGHAFQIDVYRLTDEHGKSWETLKASGSLNTSTDGGFLAYDAMPTPYRVITPEEYPCTTPTQPSSSPTPSASSSPTPSASSSPTAPATGSPSASPSPSTGPTSSPSPSVPTEPTPTPSSSTNPSPSASASSTPTPTSSPTATGTPSPTASAPNSTPSSGSAPSSTTVPSATGSTTAASSRTGELAYTGADPRPGIIAASVLVAAGIGLILFRRVRRG